MIDRSTNDSREGNDILETFEYSSGTGNSTITPATPAYGIMISNDSASYDLTMAINSMTMTVKANENMTLRFAPFSTVAVVATGAWRVWLMQ